MAAAIVVVVVVVVMWTYRPTTHLTQALHRHERRVEASGRTRPVLVKQKKALLGRVRLGFGQGDTPFQIGHLEIALLANLCTLARCEHYWSLPSWPKAQQPMLRHSLFNARQREQRPHQQQCKPAYCAAVTAATRVHAEGRHSALQGVSRSRRARGSVLSHRSSSAVHCRVTKLEELVSQR